MATNKATKSPAHSVLARKFLVARSVYNAVSAEIDAILDPLFDAETMTEAEEDAKAAEVCERFNSQAALDERNRLEGEFLAALELFLGSNGRADMFEDLSRRPVKCAKIAARG